MFPRESDVSCALPCFLSRIDTNLISFIKQRGIDALINMCLIGPVLNLGAMFIGFSSALLAYLYVLFTDPAYNKTGTFTPVIVAFSFLVGVQICNVFTVPISSGVDTIVSIVSRLALQLSDLVLVRGCCLGSRGPSTTTSRTLCGKFYRPVSLVTSITNTQRRKCSGFTHSFRMPFMHRCSFQFYRAHILWLYI